MSSTIEVTNFNNNDVICYSLVLLKGVIYSNEVNSPVNSLIACECNGKVNSWPVFNSNFRCLVLLNKGRNEIVLNFDGISIKICLIYSKKVTDFCVFPLLIVFNESNGNNVNNNEYCVILSRISFCAKLLQCFYAEKLYESGYGHRTFVLIDDIYDKAGCHLFHSTISLESARQLGSEVLWESIGREIMNSSIGCSKFKYLGVALLTDSNVNKVYEIALGSGGLALIDSHPVFTWPSSVDEVLDKFKDKTQLDPPLNYNVWYRGTQGGCCSASIGSLCHELGHTFDLAHPSSGIMSTDFHLFHNAFLPCLNSNKKETTFDLHFIPNLTNSSLRSKVNNFKKLMKNKFVDESSFTPGCLAILAHHKWFNTKSLDFNINFDSSRLVLQSQAGLKVVQIRGDYGKVIKSWELTGEKIEHMVLPRFQSSLTVFAMDKYGNIFKFPCNFQMNN